MDTAKQVQGEKIDIARALRATSDDVDQNSGLI